MKRSFLLFVAISICSFFYGNAQDPYLGEIRMFAGNYAPVGWLKCEGQLLSIASYSALFSIMGTTYGGDGETTFALPDLRSRVPLMVGQGPGLSNRAIGSTGGTETNNLTIANMPSHSHTVNAVSGDGNASDPNGGLPAGTKLLDPEYSTANADAVMNTGMIGNTGNGQAVNNMQPYLTINFIIAIVGVYPTPSE